MFQKKNFEGGLDPIGPPLDTPMVWTVINYSTTPAPKA